MLHVKDKVIVVTGSSSGIGKELAVRFADMGAKVVVHGRKPEKINHVMSLIEQAGQPAISFQADLKNYDEAAQLIAYAHQHYGKIDVLINNAGGAFPAPAENISANGWRTVIEMNLNSTFFCSKEVFKIMKEQPNGGKIINMSSIAGFLPDVDHVHYSTAKAGLIRMTETLAVEWAKYGITVNCIAPGFVQTEGLALQGESKSDNIPMGRLATPYDVFGAALFFVSDLSNYITAETIRVDGGMRGALRF